MNIAKLLSCEIKVDRRNKKDQLLPTLVKQSNENGKREKEDREKS